MYLFEGDKTNAQLRSENTRLQKGVAEAEQVILGLRRVLPDSEHGDKSWTWCWEELSSDAQDLVKEKREPSLVWLKEYGSRKV